MKQNKDFLNALDDWGSVLTDTYEKGSTHIAKYNRRNNGELYVPKNYAKDLGPNVIGTTITVPDGVQSIEFSAFANCSSVIKVQLPDTLTRIDALAFNECVNLTTINIPEGLEQFDMMSFSNCESLENINLNTKVTTIPTHCFYSCNFKTLEMPPNIKKIDGSAFNWCKELKTLKLNEGLEFIGVEAFGTCLKLTGELVIPRTVEFIDSDAFANTRLTKIYVDESQATRFNNTWNRICPAKIVYY